MMTIQRQVILIYHREKQYVILFYFIHFNIRT